MIKLLKLGGLLAFVIFSIQTASAQGSNYDGFYMGAEGSFAQTKHNGTQRIDPTYNGIVSAGDLRSEVFRDPIFTDDGFGAGFFIGYRLSQGRITVATEATYNYNFIKNEPNVVSSFEQTNEFGGSVLPGFWVTDKVVAFGRVGFSQLTTKSMSGTDTFSNSDTGLLFGGGIELFFTDSLSFRAQYTRSTHNHSVFDWVDVYNLVDGLAVHTSSALFEYNYTIKRDKYAGSLVYTF